MGQLVVGSAHCKFADVLNAVGLLQVMACEMGADLCCGPLYNCLIQE